MTLDEFCENYFSIKTQFDSNTVSLSPTYLTFPQVSWSFELKDEKVFGFGQVCCTRNCYLQIVVAMEQGQSKRCQIAKLA